jgi:hypothetical protein
MLEYLRKKPISHPDWLCIFNANVHPFHMLLNLGSDFRSFGFRQSLDTVGKLLDGAFDFLVVG